MIELRRTVLLAVALLIAMALFIEDQGCIETVNDAYLDAPAVTLLQGQGMMSAVSAPKAVASRGGGGENSKEEIYLLAKIIECEARYEPYEGKVAVGAVVLNRVMSGRFPNTIEEVIFQRGQFQPMTDGGWRTKEPSAQSYKAAADALEGIKPVGDNGQAVGNALFFIYEDLAGGNAAKWFKEKLEYVTTIGNHDFYSHKV